MLAAPCLKNSDIDSPVTLTNQYHQTLIDNSSLWPGSSMELQFASDIANLLCAYRFKNPIPIVQFLKQNPALIQILYKAPSIIYPWFKDDRLFLELVKDPEFDRWMLVLYIQTSKDLDQVMAALDRINAAWWFRQNPEIHKRLLIDVMFK